jgi:hypothetical protein
MSEVDLTVAGDDDHWMLLERLSSQDLLLIVRYRINPIVAEFAQANRVIAVILDLRPDHVRDDGFPTRLDDLHRLEDQIVEAVGASDLTAFHTASVTGDGRRVQYFAIDAAMDVASAIAGVSSPLGQLSVYNDFDFATYRDFVTPTPLDKQFNGDRSVIANLQKHGDDGSTPRKIDFWFYGARSALEPLVEQLSGNGFVLDHWLDEPVGVVLTTDASADMRSFGEITPLLVQTAAEFGVEYDGWETLVITERPQLEPTSKPSLFGRLFGQRKH